MPQTSVATDAVNAVITRYGSLSGDEAAFAASLARPLSPCVWAHPLRLDRDRLAGLLADDGISSEPIPWCDTGLRLDPTCRPGLTWPYRAGLMQIQEESAMLSVRLLDPEPGDRVLDLCAAPGNKTAQIAVALRNGGTVVANDRNVGRLAPLHATISRLGLINVTTTAHNGVNYPAENGSFDKVLVDAPCTGEGTIRKGMGKHKPVTDAFRRWVNGVQRGLLNRAVDLCRPGGRIVYSTCTFSPDENEAIVGRILSDRPDDIRVVAMTVPGLLSSTGLARWQDRTVDPALAGAIRLWPHVSDTGGFFAIALERTGASHEFANPPDTAAMNAAPSTSLTVFEDRFGLPATVFSQRKIIGGSNQRRLTALDHRPPARPAAVATGLALTRDKARHPKLSTQATQAFGGAATRNLVELRRDEVDAYMERTDLSLPDEGIIGCDGAGQVIVRYQGFALGIGELRRDGRTWRLESLFPGGRG